MKREKWVWVISIALAAFVLFANDGFHHWVARTREKRRLLERLERLKVENEALNREWKQIREDRAYTEFLIRKTLGYVKKGEVEYQIMKKDKP